ncbi:MAG TPA: DUF1684 domain-containing protein [Lentimicrobium sp.]|nr:DUF1684 domain-containing protein [Lentimicrobium sp.]
MAYKGIVIVFLLMVSVVGYTQKPGKTSNKDYVSEIEKERIEKNQEFINPDESPLPAEEIKDFKGLNYYKPSSRFRITARLERFSTPDTIKMKTTTERLPLYIVFGRAIFSIGSLTDTLTIFRNVGLMTKEGYEDYLFVPFRDETSGEGSYGGGRYIDARIPQDDHIVLDFNRAYNPYCVYNKKKYSCPIPPQENFIDARIKAGEKDYH